LAALTRLPFLSWVLSLPSYGTHLSSCRARGELPGSPGGGDGRGAWCGVDAPQSSLEALEALVPSGWSLALDPAQPARSAVPLLGRPCRGRCVVGSRRGRGRGGGRCSTRRAGGRPRSAVVRHV